MQTYSEFQPTGFDSKGLGLPDRQDWLVLPVSRTRDMGAFGQANFESALELLGGKGKNVEVHIEHWGPGWFELIIVRPDTEEAKKALEIERSLADYPVLDEERLSALEHEEEEEAWDSWARHDFEVSVRGALEAELEARGHWDTDPNADVPEWIEELLDDTERLYEMFRECTERANVYWVHESSGCSVDMERVIEALDVEELFYEQARAEYLSKRDERQMWLVSESEVVEFV